MAGGMTFMTFVLTFAGTVQTHLQRVLGENFMDVQDQLEIFYVMRFGAGRGGRLGALLFIFAILAPRRELIEPGKPSDRRGVTAMDGDDADDERGGGGAPPSTCPRATNAPCSRRPTPTGCRFC